MGSPISQVQSSSTTSPQGKGGFTPNTSIAPQQSAPEGQSDGISRPAGKGGQITYPGSGGQPKMGQPNDYSNTVGSWDNTSIGTQNPSSKGKGV